MRKKGSNNYSRQEVKAIKYFIKSNKEATKPLSITKLAKQAANKMNRPYTGLYCKMLSIVGRRNKVTKKVTTTPTAVTNKVTLNRPIKIEISNNGMTFYF